MKFIHVFNTSFETDFFVPFGRTKLRCNCKITKRNTVHLTDSQLS